VRPEWLVVGLGIVVLFTFAAALPFVAAERLVPSTRRETTAWAATAGDHRGNRKRRAETRASLDAVGERYEEDHPVAGEAVAFYLRERGVAVTFAPRVHFRLREAYTAATNHP